MRKALMLAAASALVLSACQPAERTGEETASAPAADAAAPVAEARMALLERPPAVVQPPAPIAKIAYAFNYIMSVPKDRGAELMSRHELACVSAGAGYCQVISAQADWTSREPAGRLELRGQPDWINQFRSTLALDARNAGGRLDAAVTEGEDVTRGIDTAETGAKTTASLADRIRDLQARRGGTLAQRLEIERQLADLQRQYDAQQLELRALNDRVQSARLTLDYRQGGVMAADSPTRPVARALADAFGLSMGMLAVLITAGSVLLPVAVIGGAVWWAVVRRRKPAAAA
ncbi:DUF4349 domain-containing protein [Brevundimonas sp.]|uniref:DUF4349 domain-containing protein n=1 Tax=Brevundimonas sp. TaxID=1871086 RepID=UPI002D506274|nr:DUF4349 domain-containing protein [Brevundimonas sp.]HYC96439.1 DUF4349 domain-containing protein [Brevundimonas sp.]